MGGIVSSVASAITGTRSADKAADAQRYHSEQAIAAQERGYERAADLLEPFRTAGTDALEAQRAFLGLGGMDAYQDQIDLVQSSPAFTEGVRLGEESILQNAAATGGLRGGNTQRALMQFRPQLLAQLLDQQYNRLGGLTRSGQQAIMQQALQSQNLGNQIAQQQTLQGDAAAQGRLGRGLAIQQGISGLTQGLGQVASVFSGGLF